MELLKMNNNWLNFYYKIFFRKKKNYQKLDIYLNKILKHCYNNKIAYKVLQVLKNCIVL